ADDERKSLWLCRSDHLRGLRRPPWLTRRLFPRPNFYWTRRRVDVGMSTCQMVGIMTNDRRALTRTGAFGFYAGVYAIGGQTRWSECYFEKNYYGAYWARHTVEFGDMEFVRVDFSLNTRAGIGCAPGDTGPVTSLFNKCIFDAEPY